MEQTDSVEKRSLGYIKNSITDLTYILFLLAQDNEHEKHKINDLVRSSMYTLGLFLDANKEE